MDAKQTPLIELLRDVPPSARALREVSEYEHHNIPYGRLMNEAADSIDALESQLDAIKSAAAGMIEEIIAALENERKNALAGAEYYAFCKAIDTVRSVQRRHENKEKTVPATTNDSDDSAVPFLAIDNNELGAHTEIVECAKCGGTHQIEYGTSQTLLPDGVTWSEPQPSRTLGFYTCGDKTYLGTVEGRALK